MTVVDITHLLDQEQGTAFDNDSVMFTSFDNGEVFHYDDANIRDFKDAIKTDGKLQTLQKVLALPIRGASMRINRGQAREDVTSFVENVLFQPANNGGMSTSMNTIVAQMCQAIVYRKAYFEKVWTVKDGKFAYDKVAWRPPSTCAIQRDPRTGAFKGFRQMPVRVEDTEELVYSPLRSFVYIHGVDTDPMDGKSDLDVALWCYQTKQKIRFLWYSFLEGQSLPKTIVKSQTQSTADAAAKKLVGLRSGGVVGLSEAHKVDTLESSGRGADQFKAAMQWLDAEASGSVLAGFTDLGAAATSGIGSFALSKDQTDFFLMSEQAKSREMSDAINQYLIPDLVRWNFGPNEAVPQFEFGPIAQDDASAAIGLLQAIGVTESPVIPPAFYAELIEKVASFLELDTKTVRESVVEHQKQAKARVEKMENNQDPQAQPAREVAPLAGAVNGAFNMMKQANARANAE